MSNFFIFVFIFIVLLYNCFYRKKVYMLDFSFNLSTYYEFGKDKELLVGNLIKRFGGKRVLIHYGGGSVVRNGLLDRVKCILEEEKIDYFELGGVVANPESDLIYEGIELVRKKKINFILAIGGGSVIDSAKAIGSGVLYDGDFLDFFRKNNRVVIEKMLPVGVILTHAAAGSESSQSIVVTNSKTKEKRGNVKCDAVRPVFAILNPELTYTVSKYQTACGIVDIMCHIMERYFSNTKDSIVTDRICEGILKSVIESGNILIKDLYNYEARANIMWAGSLAHNNLCGVDRFQDWSSHKIEHELSGLYGTSHGAGLAVIMPKWMRYVSKKNPVKFVEFNKNVWGLRSDDPIKGIEKLELFWKKLGMPTKLEEVGYSKDDLDYLVSNVDYASDGTIGNYVKLTSSDIKKIYKM